jgi:NAD(P)-dependent dehydrogenase (short-subunit alcohol dehydrogenase family)
MLLKWKNLGGTRVVKARLCVQGRSMLYRYCAERGVAHRQVGKVLVAATEDEQPALAKYAHQAAINGVVLEPLDAAAVSRLEPEVKAVSGLWSPSTGIIDSHSLMLALLGDAQARDAMLVVQTPVTGVRVLDRGFELSTGGADPMRLRCRLLVNSAGAAKRTPASDLTPQAWQDAMQAKFLSYVHMIDPVIKQMAQRRKGCIVNVVGNGGKVASPIHLPGGAANAALMLATAGLANAYAAQGIRVNAINPGLTRTDRLQEGMLADARLQGISAEEAMQRAVAKIPMGRLAEPEEIARVVLFLASDAATLPPARGSSALPCRGCRAPGGAAQDARGADPALRRGAAPVERGAGAAGWLGLRACALRGPALR